MIDAELWQAEVAADLHYEHARRARQEAVTEETLGAVVHVVDGVLVGIDTDHTELTVQVDGDATPLIAAYGSINVSTLALQDRVRCLVPQDSRHAIFDVKL